MSDWCPLNELPDLRRVGIIAIDSETNDKRLCADMGSGWPVKQGYICGISVAYRADGDVRGFYAPLCHPDTKNFNREQVYRWLRNHIDAGVRVITQNGLYDWGWLRTEAGISMPPGEQLEETSAVATLVDENRFRYSLDALCQWRGLPGKDEALLFEGIEALGLVTNKRKKIIPQHYLHLLPARYVGPYAEADAINTLLLWEDLNPILDREGTRAAYRLECDLLPMVLEMRLRGIRVDLAAAERARDLLFDKRDAALSELTEKLGCLVSMHELGRSKWLAATFDRVGIAYPRTENGNPSFTGGQLGWMRRHPHWLPQLIATANRYNKAASDFLQNHILDHAINGRVYAEIHPHRSEENGTKSFRFSYSDPPLQQMPSRDPEITPLVRGVLLPEEGEVWAETDVSQQEFRFVLHYANQHKLRKAAEMVARYDDDPDTDFHALTATNTKLDRSAAKQVNFAKIYGTGVRTFANMVNKPVAEAEQIYEQYDREWPFLRQLSEIYTRLASRQGYVVLYDSARRHFDKWAPGGKWGKGAGPCSLEEAQERLRDPQHPWYQRGKLYRADTRNALNALVQGSAARHTKLWMRACWREGIVPLLQMHDALSISVSSREQAELVAMLGEEAVQLDVPMRVDLKFGHTWGDAKHTWAELHGETAPASKLIETAAPVASHDQVDAHEQEPPGKASANNARPRLVDIIGEPLVNDKILCRFHNDHTPSLHIYEDHFHCFVCGAHGDAIDWLREVEGLSYGAAVELLANWTGPISTPNKSTDDEDNARKLAWSARIWGETQSIFGTVGIKFLADVRKIDTDALPANIDDALRFHPRCPFGPGKVAPSLVALYRDVLTDVPAGIHRIAVTPEVFAGAKVQRLTLGQWPAARAIKLWPAGPRLFVGEGVETALAAGTRMQYRGAPMRPVWAAGSTSNIKKFPLLPGIEQLILLVDHDVWGEAACAKCCANWKAAGRETTRLRPEEPGTDFNDLVISKLRALTS